ncbi:hypothetical protein ALC56_11695 [Trachymyrmex septentrionalis]|uniref:Uncharacterized protein n=1 Tax=Trachymyrmex septentrionalis TaxID=34720 RepID=A0A195F135_9HYME|nr:hypothetical protein ALC56_11695 [Trachymyrmex septentrionalis]
MGSVKKEDLEDARGGTKRRVDMRALPMGVLRIQGRRRIFFDAHPRSILSLNNADAALRHTRPRQLAQIVDESALVEKFHWLSGFSNEPVVDAFGHIDSSAVRINERLQYETGYSSYSHGVDGHSIADSEGLTNHNANGSL